VWDGITRSLPRLTGLPLLFRAGGAHSLMSEALPEHNQGFSDLSIRAANRDVTLVCGTTLENKGSDPSARNVSDLFKTATLMSNDMTRKCIRDDTGHLEVVGLALSREGLSK
jgi:hypothetical protein